MKCPGHNNTTGFPFDKINAINSYYVNKSVLLAWWSMLNEFIVDLFLILYFQSRKLSVNMINNLDNPRLNTFTIAIIIILNSMYIVNIIIKYCS